MCRTCGRHHREHPQPNDYTPVEQETILRAYQERRSQRGLTRTFAVSRTTVIGWIKKAAQLSPLSITLLPAQTDDMLERDEQCPFVRRKIRQVWLWLAICRRTHQVVAFALGDRTVRTCLHLWKAVPTTYRHTYCFHDFWAAYNAILPDDQHEGVGKETSEINHSERFNNTLRQRLGRLMRKTLSFSKSWHMHAACKLSAATA